MKTEKYMLIVLCALVCLWSIKMAIGVIGLAQHQGGFAVLALLEVAVFAAAGAIPLVLASRSRATRSRWLLVVWLICAVYVTLLAANTVRLGLLWSGLSRLVLWTLIAVLFTRLFAREFKEL